MRFLLNSIFRIQSFRIPIVEYNRNVGPTIRRFLVTGSSTKLNANFSVDNKNRKSTGSQPIDGICNWQTIYIFPFIVPCRIFARAKLYMTVLMTTVLPVSYFNSAEVVTTSDIAMLTGLSGFSLAVMYGFGHLFRRLIGSVYVSEDGKLVRISHLTFFGNRGEKIINTDELLTLTDTNANLNDLILQVCTLDVNGQKDTLFMCLRFGGIKDFQRFNHLFGVA